MLLVIAGILVTVVEFGLPDRSAVAGPAVLAVASAAVAVLVLRSGLLRRDPSATLWRPLGAVAVLLALGQAGSAMRGAGVNTVEAGWNDVPLLAAVPFAVVAGRRLLRCRGSRQVGSRVLLDAVVVLLAVGMLAEVVVSDALAREDGAAGSLISVGYPALGALLCGVGLVVVTSARHRERPLAGWLMVGCAAVAVVGISGAVAGLAPSAGLDVLTGWSWLVLVGALLRAALAEPSGEAPAGTGGATDGGVTVPLAGVLFSCFTATAVVLLVVGGGALGRPIGPVEAVGCGLLVVLTFARSVVWAVDGQRLAVRLQRAEGWFRGLVQDSADVTLVLDRDGRVAWASSAVAHQLGWSERHLVGCRLRTLAGPDDRALVDRLVRDGVPPGSAVVLRLRTRHDGWRDLEVAGGPAPGRHPGLGAPDGDRSGGTVLRMRDVTERRSAERRLEEMAYTDHLTRLPNRARFAAALDEASAGARAGLEVSLLLLDLDGFKQINDLAGHDVGDEVLLQVADRLRAVVRDQDLVARLGGDEFAVLVHAGPAEATALAERIVAVLGAGHPLHARGRRGGAGDGLLSEVSCSVGVAAFTADDDGATVVQHADAALRVAKGAGKNCVRVHAESVDSPSWRRARLAADLPAALAAGALHLAYQPVVGLAERRVLGIEAVVRWDHPELGPVSPEDFLVLAEDDGLIVPLQQWMLRQATLDHAGWLAAGRDLQLGMDISARHLRAGCLGDDVAAALAASGLPASRLMLELTESVLLDDQGRATAEVRALHETGCIISLDDFGRGSSALALLARLPVAVLKMDRALLQGIEHDPRQAALVQAVVELGGRLAIDVVAGGVDTPAQLGVLCALGCSYVQGALLGAAVPAAGLPALVDAFDPSILDVTEDSLPAVLDGVSA